MRDGELFIAPTLAVGQHRAPQVSQSLVYREYDPPSKWSWVAAAAAAATANEEIKMMRHGAPHVVSAAMRCSQHAAVVTFLSATVITADPHRNGTQLISVKP